MIWNLLRRLMATEVKHVPIPPRGVDYRGKVVLAPMVRSGELPSRLLALRYGADLVWGPETIDKALIGTTRRFNEDLKILEWARIPSHGMREPPPDAKQSIIYRVHPEKEANKHIFQIGTNDPDRAVQAARLVAADVAGIDVNAGCPKPFSTHGGMGAALLQTPDHLCSILEALVKNIIPEFDIGISVKIRLLETPEKTEALVRKLCATGITGLTIHCRTTPMRPRERAIRDQLRMIADVCHEAGVACLMNGDVETREQGLQLAAEFGADGAMIATCAEKNPTCFRTAEQGGSLPWEAAVEEYIKAAMEVHNRFPNTKYLLTQMIPGKTKYYKLVCQVRTYTDACKALELEHLVEQAREVDAQMGPDKPTGKAARKAQMNASAQAAGGQMAKTRVHKDGNRKELSDRQPPVVTEAETPALV